MTEVDLYTAFDELNVRWFGGELKRPKLYWNTRLRSSAGRFYPGNRLWRVPVIEVAAYLKEEGERAVTLITETLGHEMIHYWLWSRRKPYGHTAEFLAKMREIGVARYNPVPRLRPPKYVYVCPGCSREYPARRRWRGLACARCCDEHNGGKFHPRFQLRMTR